MVVHRTDRQGHAAAAEHTGEVVGVVLDRGIEGFTAGQQAAAHQAPLLQPAQLPVDGGQADAALILTQPAVQLLAAQFRAGPTQGQQQQLLAGIQGHRGDGWVGWVSHRQRLAHPLDRP
jgi:hypothetical protein